MPNDIPKMKITQKEFDNLYEIEKTELTVDEVKTKLDVHGNLPEESEPEFLTEEEEQHDTQLSESLNWDEENKE